MRILLIDDDAAELEVIESYLEFYIPDLTPLTTTQGMEAVRICRHAPFDIVILDTNLADSDGIQVLSAIRGTSDIPIIAIHGSDDDDITVRLLKTGADEVMARPFEMSALLSGIDSLLKKQGVNLVFRFAP